jgi:hypothetical protein
MFCLCSDKMSFFPTVKVCYSLETHVIRFRGSGSEYYGTGVGADKRGDVTSGGLDGFFGFPSVGMGAGVWVAVEGREVGDHGVEDAGISGGGGLGIEVDGTGSVFENGGFVD